MSNATIQEINSSIMFGNFTNDQLNSIMTAVKYARAQLTKQTASSLRIGASVKFTSSRSGRVVTGTVESIKIKNVIVNTALGRYRVPANMLEAA